MAPSQSRFRPRRTLGFGLALALVGASVGLTSAAPNRPTVSVTPTVAGTSSSVVVGVNRGPNAIASCTYVLDSGAASSCGTASAAGKKAAAYTISLTGLSGGEHTITVTVTLADGGGATGSATFTIAPARVFAVAFTNLDGLAGYNPAADALIAQLVDTNRDNQLSVGDMIDVGTFPGDLNNSSRIAVNVATHTVSEVSFGLPTAVLVTSDGGSSEYFWSGGLGGYTESAFPGIGTRVLSFGSSCVLEVNTLSPSQPTTGVATVEANPCQVDIADVAFDVP